MEATTLTIDHHVLTEFDAFLQTESFRCLHVKIPFNYYTNFVLVSLEMSESLLDWLYADVDIFMASWSAERKQRLLICCNSASLNKQGYGFVLLGFIGLSRPLAIVYSEDRLVVMYFRCTVTLAILRIPETTLDREDREESIFAAFEEYLSSREFKLYFRETFRDTVKSVQHGGVASTATLGVSSTVSTLGHATAGFALTLAVDVAITARAVCKARKLRKAGEITDREFKTTVKRKVRQTSCQLVGGSTGSMIGQIVIPVPVVGAMIGGFVGSLIGTGLSKGIDKIEEVRELKKPAKDLMRRDVSPARGAVKNVNESLKKIQAKLRSCTLKPRKSNNQ